ncbi:Protein kinase, ATP binding site-containing protein [Artemisia annua]|uniref:non-specific serine/threonine protein kinase n=1 Tax=Artemisia annua TaxID=35608 RepID=A0A2U1KRN9_ARTAN|nr:Protein kinase, ATP binding site-containing protein [Artemisia annua]
MIIIHDHEANGCLGMYLSDPALTWIQRLEISFGVAEAICYLHNEEWRNYSIIHRNINSSTILIDDDFGAKLSGFEFSIKDSVDRRERYISSEVIGTQGYMAPETIKSGDVTQKSDVYSYGVVLCEILCGRKAFLPDESKDNKFLAPLVRFHVENDTLDEVIHPDLLYQRNLCHEFARLACDCTKEDRVERPDMSQILEKLLVIRESLSKDKEDENGPSKGELENAAKFYAWKFPQRELEDTNENDALEGESEDADENDVSEGESEDTDENTSSNAWKVNKFEHLRIGLVDILLATENFSEEYGIGSELDYCKFYDTNLECFDREYNFSLEGKNKGELPKRYYDVSIKCIKRRNMFYTEDMFYKEIEILGPCMHENIQPLLGFCDEGGHMILVYEKKTDFERLSKILNSLFLTWEIRLKICLDIAHGLNYIHNKMDDQKMVIHRKISSEVIVCDVIRHRVIITGFELSTFFPSDHVEDVDDFVANGEDVYETYIAPEFIETGKATKESDIYSFGLVMFEILCGQDYVEEVWQKNFWQKKEKYAAQPKKGIIKQKLARAIREKIFGYKKFLKKGIIKQKMARPIREENFDNKNFLRKGPNEESLDTFIKIIKRCLAINRKQRPTLQVIIQELEKALLFHKNHKDPLRISFEDIKLATQSFSRANDIGGGGFGRVYKGELASEHGSSTIVAKRLDTRLGQGDQQFYNELHILSEYKHENVIGFVGYNNAEQERIIVYEYASKGSLDNYLNDASLTWINRLNICIDVARGLAFLHGGVREHEAVIHRDMKTANILLFDDWKAKVADFGLSLICTINAETDYVIDYACGTPGYLDPRYKKSRILTKESDIYSFGIILLEILFGRSTYEVYKHEGQFLHTLVNQRFEEGRLDEVVFNAIKNQIVQQSLVTFLEVAYQCLCDDRVKRPTAQDVLVQLQKALELQVSTHVLFQKSWFL